MDEEYVCENHHQSLNYANFFNVMELLPLAQPFMFSVPMVLLTLEGAVIVVPTAEVHGFLFAICTLKDTVNNCLKDLTRCINLPIEYV